MLVNNIKLVTEAGLEAGLPNKNEQCMETITYEDITEW